MIANFSTVATVYTGMVMNDVYQPFNVFTIIMGMQTLLAPNFLLVSLSYLILSNRMYQQGFCILFLDTHVLML